MTDPWSITNNRMHLTGYSGLGPLPRAGDAGRWLRETCPRRIGLCNGELTRHSCWTSSGETPVKYPRDRSLAAIRYADQTQGGTLLRVPLTTVILLLATSCFEESEVYRETREDAQASVEAGCGAPDAEA